MTVWHPGTVDNLEKTQRHLLTAIPNPLNEREIVGNWMWNYTDQDRFNTVMSYMTVLVYTAHVIY